MTSSLSPSSTNAPQSARTRRSQVIGLALLLLGALPACGRTELSRPCTTTADCPNNQVCVAGACDDPRVVPDMTVDPDMPVDPDMTVDPDMPIDPDMDKPPMCTTSAQCPGGGASMETPDGRCVASVCDAAAGQCVQQDALLGCPPDTVQIGCSCQVRVCRRQEECGDQGCVRGQCGPCESRVDCDGQVCNPDGTCGGCRTDDDCGARQICDVATQECKDRPRCVINDDCEANEVCLSGQCTFSPDCRVDADCREGFECVGGSCYEKLCRGPQDCPAEQLCDAGRCIDPPPNIVQCFIATPSSTIAPGQEVLLEAFAVDSQGNGVAANFIWTSSLPQSVQIDRGRIAKALNVAGAATISAVISGGDPVRCDNTIQLTNVGQPQPGGLRVQVVNAESGQPVANATVVLSGQPPRTTNAQGLVSFPQPGGAVEVSVFSDPFNYVTVQNVSASDLRIPLNPRSGRGPVGGFSGQFDTSQITSSGDFTIGLAGASLPGGLINFELSKLLGDPIVTRLNVPLPDIGQLDLPLPAGLVLFGRVIIQIDLKLDYYATSPGGARLAWGLAGKVPAPRLIEIFRNGNFNSPGDVLATLLPLFNRFDHALKPVNLNALPRIVDTADFDNDGNTSERVPDFANFPTVGLKPSVPQQLLTNISVSNFPTMSNGPAEVAVLVGGTQLQAPGFVPMGISATLDDNGDGVPDTRVLTMTPPYGSAVGGRFALMAIALRTDSFGGANPANGIELPDEFSIALWNGQQLPTSIQLGTFPSSTSGNVNNVSRTVTLNAKAGPLFRVRLVGNARTWDVWSQSPGGPMGTNYNHTVTVPAAPAGATDLMNGSKILVDAIRTLVDVNDLVRPSGVQLNDVALVSTGFNRSKLRD